MDGALTTMTPKGVEHAAALLMSSFTNHALTTMTPKGVEHSTIPVVKERQASALTTMTPKGVEHENLLALVRRGWVRADHDDAERR